MSIASFYLNTDTYQVRFASAEALAMLLSWDLASLREEKRANDEEVRTEAAKVARLRSELFPIMARALVLSLVVALASAEVEGKCRGCSGEQCQLCRENKNTVSACVSSCMENICKGCGGEQCQLCREDANTLNSCCSGTEGIDMCKAESKDPCDGIYGADGLQCAWEQDANTIAACCDDHYHSVTPPKMCIDSKEEAVTGCFDTKCRGCGGEQCQLCREDAKSQCCTGAMLL